MLMSQVDNTITLTFSPDEMIILDWVTVNYSGHEFLLQLSNWLQQKTAQMNESKKGDFWAKVKDHPEIMDTAIKAVDAKVKIKP